MGLIDSQGLVKAQTEAELHSLASAAYRAYRRDRYHNLKFEAPYQWIRNKFGRTILRKRFAGTSGSGSVGVWDTVAAYGMPVDEMTRGIHQYIWPIELPNNRLSARVMRACQALALDEERTTFHPQLWDETAGINGNIAAPDVDGGASSRTNVSVRSGSPACTPMLAAVIPTMCSPTSPLSGR